MVWLKARLTTVRLRDVKRGASNAEKREAPMRVVGVVEPVRFEHLLAEDYIDDKDVEVVEGVAPSTTPAPDPATTVVVAEGSADSDGEPAPPAPRRRRGRRKRSS